MKSSFLLYDNFEEQESYHLNRKLPILGECANSVAWSDCLLSTLAKFGLVSGGVLRISKGKVVDSGIRVVDAPLISRCMIRDGVNMVVECCWYCGGTEDKARMGQF